MKQTITLATHDDPDRTLGLMQVEADVEQHGLLGIHSWAPNRWTVTHVPSGIALAAGLEYADAQRLRKALIAAGLRVLETAGANQAEVRHDKALRIIVQEASETAGIPFRLPSTWK